MSVRPHSPLWPDRRVKPPYGAVEIDWTHPLAFGCLTYALPFGGVHVPGPVVLTGMTWNSRGDILSTATSGQSAEYNGRRGWPLGTDLTIAVQYTRTGTSDGAIASVPASDTAWSAPYYKLGLTTGYTNSRPALWVDGTGASASANCIVATLQPQMIVGRKVGTASTWCVDGTFTTGGTYASNKDGTTTGVSLYALCRNRTAGGEGNVGAVGLIAIWNRALTDGEMLQMSFDPYCFLRPVVRRSYVVLGAAAGQSFRPISDVAAGGWTPSTGTDLFACVDEAVASDTDYIRSGASPDTDTAILGLPVINTPAAGTVTLRVRAKYVS